MSSSSLPRITVITPSYNQGPFLRQTICSVLSQDYPKLEYILIDGGSTDGSVEIIRSFADRIHYWVSEPDDGQSHAINKGFRRARGDIVCWLNSDDLFLPGALKRVGQAFARYRDAQVITGYTVRADSHLRLLFNYFVPVQKDWLARHGVLYFSQPSTFWKRGLFDELDFLDESLHLAMDVDLWLRFLSAKVKIVYLKQFLAVWRLHENCKSIKYVAKREHEHAVLRDRYGIKDSGVEALFARSMFRLEKVLNGDYLRHWSFRSKWKGKPLSEFVQKLSRGIRPDYLPETSFL